MSWWESEWARSYNESDAGLGASGGGRIMGAGASVHNKLVEVCGK